MKTKIIFFLFITVFTCSTIQAQININDYKYVIVPNKFDFLNEPDQYRLNTLTKLLLEKHGFTTITEDEKFPEDAVLNNCLSLKANVLNESGIFNSKLKIQLKNCKNEIVFTSDIGSSREKLYQVAYTLALREAFRSFHKINYQYQENPEILVYSKKGDKVDKIEIEKLKEEIKVLKEEKEAQNSIAIVDSTLKEETKVKDNIAEVKDTNTIDVLTAVSIANGYQLKDNMLQVVYTIKKTGIPNVYIVENKEAIIYMLNASWVMEYYENQKLQSKTYNIKF
ncbi:hypothetical protein KO494_07400 [Lacinutrix sp. C3R15]|uniref:hypothetical protein n=1 Tax=Flavobacteriaceae TaxID=49546 RepID=UPI001C0A11DA|nr:MULTISPECIES: hypothetical protein [Flavobacteriaceae]MBU2939362.1 hypothetical protein [Lacinutrix sp. C3R15]MDO6622677.1 hypothetical protein [Oceanihabitans sp. 1_MG-2023]